MKPDRSALPTNVRRWLDRTLPVDSPVPDRIYNSQNGEMDTRGRWTPFTAQTSYSPDPFSFLWKARLKPMSGFWITAEDGHDGVSGWGNSKLWGFIPMGGRQGPDVFEMQIVRSLAELPWIPQFALTIPGLDWQDTGENQFETRIRLGNGHGTVTFDLNQDDEIVCASGKRKYDVPEGFLEAPWYYDFADYCDHEGVHFPGTASAVYEKPEGVWEYWRGTITSLSFES